MPKIRKQKSYKPVSVTNIINVPDQAALELGRANEEMLKRFTDTIGNLIENQQTISNSVDDHETLIKVLLDDNEETRREVERVNERVTQLASVESKPSVALTDGLQVVAKSFAALNKKLAEIAQEDNTQAYQAEAMQNKPSPSTTPVEKKGAKPEESTGLFGLLKNLFTNPAVVAALAGIVYTVLPKDIQDKIKAFLSGFVEGLNSTSGDEESGIKGLGTALKIAAAAIAVAFGAKMIGNIVSAISTTIKIIRAMRGMSGKKMLALGAGIAVGAAIISDDEGEPVATKTEGEPGTTPDGVAAAPAPMIAATTQTPTPAITEGGAGAAPAYSLTETKPALAPSTGVGMTPGGGLGLKMPEQTVKDAISVASKRVGVDESIMLAMAKQESSFNPNAKAGTSSASGLFQFIDSTWNNMVSKYGSAFPELNKGRFDPIASAIAGALYIKENSEYLKKNGIPINGTTIYASHFLGPGGAKTLLSADPSVNAAGLLPAAAAANKNIFYNKDNSPRTVAQVIEILYGKVGRVAEGYAAMIGGQPSTALAAAPVPNTPTTGTAVARASVDIKTRPSAPKTEVATVNKTEQKGDSQVAMNQLPIPSPIANRGSLFENTKHSTAYV